MNLLRNPMVTGALAVAAVAMVFYQFGGAKRFRSTPKAASSAAAVAPPALATQPGLPGPNAGVASQPDGARSAPTGSNASAETAQGPERSVDREYAATHYKAWVSESRRRDPFLLIPPSAGDSGPSGTGTNSPVASWKLKAIWNQTGSRLAVINNHVYRVGDQIQGYKIFRIANDEVWFQGPDRKERLGFEPPPKAPAKSTANGHKPGTGVPPNGNLTT